MTVPYAFGAATSAIPLSQLDSNFNTPITLGNTAIQLGNTVTTLNNMTLANVTISSGNVTITNVTVTTANATTVNTTTLIATTGNVTTVNATDVNVATSVTLNAGTANGVAYLNGSKVLTTGSALTFDGTTLGSPQVLLPNGNSYQIKSAAGVASAVLGMDASNNLYLGASGAVATNIFYTGGSEQMRLDSSGNLGLGVTPSAWGTGLSALDINGRGGVAYLASAGNFLSLSNNVYYNAGYKYKATAAAGQMNIGSDGSFVWLTAPSGTAGNAISFTQAMTLDASGNLLVGTTINAGSPIVYGGTNTIRNVDSAQGGIETNNDNGNASVAGYAMRYIQNVGSGYHAWETSASLAQGAAISYTERARIDSSGNFVAGGSVALATTATDGFLYVPTCAGTPTGTPTAITGMAPIVVNTTNNKLYFYSGGAWRDAGP